MALSDQIVERLRSILPRENLVAHANNLNALPEARKQKISLIRRNMNNSTPDQLSVFFLAEGEQEPGAVMARLTNFIGSARASVDFALYDMRLGDVLKNQLMAALRDAAGRGVQIRICYDGDKPLNPNLAAGQDPAPPGTSAFVQSLGFPWRRIAGMKLMHQKFIVRDRSAVWTGSLNLTDDAFRLMENNVVQIESPTLAAYYARDFEQLW